MNECKMIPLFNVVKLSCKLLELLINSRSDLCTWEVSKFLTLGSLCSLPKWPTAELYDAALDIKGVFVPLFPVCKRFPLEAERFISLFELLCSWCDVSSFCTLNLLDLVSTEEGWKDCPAPAFNKKMNTLIF